MNRRVKVHVPDQSDLDKKYFVDGSRYNCPYCNRRHVVYDISGYRKFNWTDTKECWAIFVQCEFCQNVSLHLTFEDIVSQGTNAFGVIGYAFDRVVCNNIDSHIFYHQPTSFSVMDVNLAKVIRELITEAEGCLKMNFLTGASACTRKAIYELLVDEKIPFTDEEGRGIPYQDRIKTLKDKDSSIDPTYFDLLGDIQDMTSDKVHEQSWDKWNSGNLTLILETLKTVLHEMYVEPAKRKERFEEIRRLRQDSSKKQQPPTAEELKTQLAEIEAQTESGEE